MPYWLSFCNTITFQEYFWCSRFCEFHSKCHHHQYHSLIGWVQNCKRQGHLLAGHLTTYHSCCDSKETNWSLQNALPFFSCFHLKIAYISYGHMFYSCQLFLGQMREIFALPCSHNFQKCPSILWGFPLIFWIPLNFTENSRKMFRWPLTTKNVDNFSMFWFHQDTRSSFKAFLEYFCANRIKFSLFIMY